jgi:hypothetical protein
MKLESNPVVVPASDLNDMIKSLKLESNPVVIPLKNSST